LDEANGSKRRLMHLAHLGERMKAERSAVKRLYLMQLVAMNVPIGPGKMLPMSSGSYLLETRDGKRILIDSGMAPDVPVSAPAGAETIVKEKNVLEHLKELGVAPQQIDTVICTHFDVDHAGYHDHFLIAEFVVQRKHYQLARAGAERYAKGRKHWDDPRLKYRLVDGDVELFPGIELVETSGHCIGHQSVLVRLPASGPVLLAIDAALLKRTFTMDRKAGPYDEDERLLLASTRKMLDLVERESVKLVVFGHDGEQWNTLKRSPEFYE
jgi:N-acyl homoserine lactone hydrolase